MMITYVIFIPKGATLFDLTAANILLHGTASLTGILVNVVVIYWTKKNNTTLVDNLILLDSAANIGTLLIMLMWSFKQVWRDVVFCVLRQMSGVFLVHINRVLPVTIAVYRYVLICQAGNDLTRIK